MPEAIATAPRPRGRLRRLFSDYVWHHRLSLSAGACFLAVTNWLTVSIPGEIGGAVDALRVDDASAAGRHALYIALMGAAVIGVRTASRVLFFNPGRDVEYRVRADLFTHLLALQPEFYAGRKTGDIVSRASTDITYLRVLVGFASLQVVNVAFAVVLTGWKMLAISPQLTGLALLPVGVGLILVQFGIHQVFELSKRYQEQLGDISDHVLSSFQGVATIHGFVAEAAFERRFADKNAEWFKTGLKLALVRSLFFPLLVLGGGLAVYVILAVGGPLAIAGTITVGELAAFSTLLVALLPPLRSLGWMLSVVQRGQASMVRIFELLDSPVDRPEGDRPVVPEVGHGPAISLRGLTFAYPDAPDRVVLQDVSADLPAGAVVGIFGRTGSGKSTLLNLVARLHNPPPGSVLVDGTDVRTLDLHAWRDRMSVAPQRPFLFSDSIATNVALDDEPPPRRVEDAVDLAALGPDLASLPDGLQTVVGERGIMLSGGQRQRVALARGLYHVADLVMLDDVLSAVDHETEARLVETLSDLAHRDGGPTVLIVSHRLSAIQGADRILVLEDGRLVDQGTHHELVSRPGAYRDTWAVQQGQDVALTDGGAA